MSLAQAGLRIPGVVINDPGCVAKTYPGFFADLDRMCESKAGDAGR
jgi:3-phosphoshikimate 1-carboxyvinyltransferase